MITLILPVKGSIANPSEEENTPPGTPLKVTFANSSQKSFGSYEISASPKINLTATGITKSSNVAVEEAEDFVFTKTLPIVKPSQGFPIPEKNALTLTAASTNWN